MLVSEVQNGVQVELHLPLFFSMINDKFFHSTHVKIDISSEIQLNRLQFNRNQNRPYSYQILVFKISHIHIYNNDIFYKDYNNSSVHFYDRHPFFLVHTPSN